MAFEDQTLTCVDCSSEFTFTAGEQEFYESKGLGNPPKRCPDCRRAKKASFGDSRGGGGGGFNSAPREMHDAVCAQCGKETQVPFVPTGAKPVYCTDCFKAQRASNGY